MYSLYTIQKRLNLASLPASFQKYYQQAQAHYQEIIPCFSKEFLNEAFSFYFLDESKELSCYFKNALPLFETDETLKHACALVHYILYYGPFEDFFDVWQLKENPQTTEDYIIPLACLLSGFKIHQQNYQFLSKEQQLFQRKQVSFSCQKGIRFYHIPGLSFHTMVWGCYYIKGRLIQSGAFEFEQAVFQNDFNIYQSLKSSFYQAQKKQNISDELVLKKGDFYCGIHIPRGADLSMQSFEKALNQNDEMILSCFKDFQKQQKIPYLCSSWLLSPDLKDLLPKTSHIIQFQNRFDIIGYENGLDDFLRFVFNTNECTPLTMLDETTSLQRALKQRLIQNKDVKNGIGILKNRFIQGK